MKRKLWVALSMVLVLSFALSSVAFAANPNTQSFTCFGYGGSQNISCGTNFGLAVTSYSNGSTYTISTTAFFSYTDKFGADWTSYCTDSGTNKTTCSALAYTEETDIENVSARNYVFIGCGGSTFSKSIYAS